MTIVAIVSILIICAAVGMMIYATYKIFKSGEK